MGKRQGRHALLWVGYIIKSRGAKRTKPYPVTLSHAIVYGVRDIYTYWIKRTT